MFDDEEEIYESTMLKHARYELKLAGYDIEAPDKEEFETNEDYGNACAKNAYEMLKVFASAEHSGFSAMATLYMFDKLAKQENITPLTNNPEEWINLGDLNGKDWWQSKRNSACFSDDNLKTYYNIDDVKKERHELKE